MFHCITIDSYNNMIIGVKKKPLIKKLNKIHRDVARVIEKKMFFLFTRTTISLSSTSLISDMTFATPMYWK